MTASINNELFKEIAQVVIKAVNLEDVTVEEIEPETPLMGGKLELDSVDVLEAVLAIETHFQVKVKSAEDGQKYFATFGSICSFISQERETK